MSKEINYEKLITKLLWLFFFGLILLAFATSCRTLKELTDKTDITDLQSRDSSHVSEISKAIDDKINISLPMVKTSKPECDTICDQVVQDMARQMDFLKQSGDNWYSMFYNEKQRRIEFQAKIGETNNKTIIVTKARTKTITRTITKKIPVRYVPDLVKWFALFGGFCLIAIIAWIIFKAKTSWLPKKLPTV